MGVSGNADGSVTMLDGQRAIIVEPLDQPIVHAARVDLARSSGVWGIVSSEVASTEVVDDARPSGVTAYLAAIPGVNLKLFIAPASSSRVTVTALDKAGRQLAQTTLPPSN
jgi:hypothetical protein